MSVLRLQPPTTFYPPPWSILWLQLSELKQVLIWTHVLCAGTQQDRRGLRPSQQRTTEEPWWEQEANRTSRLDNQLGIAASLCSLWAFGWLITSCLLVPIYLRSASGHYPGVRHHRREVLRKHPELDEEHKRGGGSQLWSTITKGSLDKKKDSGICSDALTINEIDCIKIYCT